MLLPDYNAETMLHSNGVVLNVDAGVGAILICKKKLSDCPLTIIFQGPLLTYFSSVKGRSKSSMDHPIHLHGRKMEILDEVIVKKSDSCDHNKCELSEIFATDEALQRLASITPGTRPLKDTFILPAGGAVATRIFTGEPALWFAHCHLESHRESGMALILSVGNYKAPSDPGWLPPDYPRCDTPFLLAKKEFPACDCYVNSDAVMDGALTKEHRCSRDYLCFHEDSPQANLESNPYAGTSKPGIAIRSQYSVPGWAISLLIVATIAIVSYTIAYREKLLEACGARKDEIKLANNEQTIHTGVKVDLGQPKSPGIALVLVNFQHEFADEKGKLYDIAKEGIKDHNPINKTAELAKVAR